LIKIYNFIFNYSNISKVMFELHTLSTFCVKGNYILDLKLPKIHQFFLLVAVSKAITRWSPYWWIIQWIQEFQKATWRSACPLHGVLTIRLVLWRSYCTGVTEDISAILVNSYGNIQLDNFTFFRNVNMMLTGHWLYIFMSHDQTTEENQDIKTVCKS
jgi:hypothetical protein